MSVIISPNMNLPVPVVSNDFGPDWANNLNSCLSAIDEHDHTAGKGVPLSSDSLTINSNLPLNNNSLTGVASVVFNAQTSIATIQSVYVVGVDLFYNDGNGNTIRITQSGNVAGASGTITGLPSGTASASYQSVGGTFQFQSATNTPANISGASYVMAEQTTSPNTITLKSPTALGASYNVTFPGSVPAFTSLLAMSTSGVLSTVPYKAPTIQKFLSGSGTYTTPSSPAPLYIKVVAVGGGGGGAGGGGNGVAGSNGGNTTFGTTLLVANGGVGGAVGAQSSGGAGGTASLGAATGIALSGCQGSGSPTWLSGTPAMEAAGGSGGGTPLGGGGGSVPGNTANTVVVSANSGAGGGGGGCNITANTFSGQGGGGGGYVDAIITSPSATYAYGVGAAGALGAGGTGGGNSAAGAAGSITVFEYYQ